MKKRIVSVLLCGAMAVAMLAGCGAKESAPAAEPAKEEVSNVTADPVDQRRVYVTPDWVKSVMDGNQKGYEDYVLLQVVYDASGDESYGKGHITGAQVIGDVEVEDGTGSEEGLYNLLAADEVEANLLKHGITKDSKVILYGEGKDDAAGVARVAYAMLWAGVEDVKVLNGGLAAWTAAGYTADETTANEGTEVKDFGTTVPAHPEYWTSIDEAKDKLKNDPNFKLVSIRSEGEFLGETSGYTYIDKAGEPDGAVWGKGCQSAYDLNDFVNEDGTVKELDGFEKVWADCDFTLDNDLAFYCGTGWRACPPFLVLYQEGYDNMSVYDGGWYQWIMDDSNPVQLGDPASADFKHTTVGELETGKALEKK